MRIKRITTIIATTAATAILSLAGSVSAFAATSPGPGVLSGPGGGYNYQYSGYAYVGQIGTLANNFAVSWTNVSADAQASAVFPWSISVYANSTNSLEWLSASVGGPLLDGAGPSVYQGPATGTWGVSEFQDDPEKSFVYPKSVGQPITGSAQQQSLDVEDSGSWVAGAWQQATQELLSGYPSTDAVGYAYWMVKIQ